MFNYIVEEFTKKSYKNNKITSLPYLDCHSNYKTYLEYFNNCWLLTETLFSSIKNDKDFFQKPYHKLRHPLIFYYNHVATFYVNKMLVAGLINKPVNKEFEDLFETGVDEMTWDVSTNDNKIKWPSLDSVKKYREEVYQLVSEVIIANKDKFGKQVDKDHQLWSLLMCFEHERIHLETSSVLIREMEVEKLKNPEFFTEPVLSKTSTENPKEGADYPENSMILISGKEVNLGKKDLQSFGWDNEFGSRDVKVNDFKASKYLISNGEFFEFVKDDSYNKDQYWCQRGLSWRKFRNIFHPTFWVPDGPKGSNLFKLRSCFTNNTMQWNFPVITNYYEAKAFCKYKSEKENKNYRLLHEKEYKILSSHQNDVVKNDNHQDFNFNLQNLSENAVDANYACNNKVHDVDGNVWQWLEDRFNPLDGFEIHPYYVDFSAPCFDDQHQMIAGSSFFSTGNLASIYSRYHFRPHFFQHAGFRIVEGCKESEDSIKIEFEAKNPNDQSQYIIFSNDNGLQVMKKSDFEKKYN